MKPGIGMVGAACMLMAAAAFAGTPRDTAIEGTYLEVRSCDVYTAFCFANSEVGLTGEEAILAWDVARGTLDGVDLAGLKVIAVVRASGTLGDTSRSVYPAKSILVVDEKADAAQRAGLIALAKEKGGRLLEDVIRIENAPIAMAIHEPAHGYATLTAGDKVAIETRCLFKTDKHCGNDDAYYGPLTKVDNAMVAYTELDQFRGTGLGVTWSNTGGRSAYLATFAE